MNPGLNSFFIIFLVLSCMSGCISESNFRLSDESRLPIWFEIPEGKKREDMSVQLFYYVKPSGREAKLVLTESDAWLATKTVRGELEGRRSSRVGDASRKEYPRYEIMNAKGLTDVIEHKGMNDIFYMVDDPAVWSELGVEQD